MTPTEIKTAWNTFKKEIAKEIDFSLTGCCYMNERQIKNGTATITLGNDEEFDDAIMRHRKSIERVNSLDTWTAEEKQRSEKRNLAIIADYTARKAAYGTKAKEVEKHALQIIDSTAYKKLTKIIGVTDAELEYINGRYQMRIFY